jgi:hypothetical protein
MTSEAENIICELIFESLQVNMQAKEHPPHVAAKLKRMRARIAESFGMNDIDEQTVKEAKAA